MSDTPDRPRLPISWVLGLAALLLVVGALLAVLGGMLRARGPAPVEPAPSPLQAAEEGEAPVLGEVPPFRLASAHGGEVGREDLLGGPWVVDFIFTTCAGICPRLAGEMRRVQEGLPEDSPVRLVSITVDPSHDTPETLRAYAEAHGAREGRWLFLTGEAEAIYRLAVQGFRLATGPQEEFDPAQGEEPFIHSSRLILVDGQGRIRGYYDGLEPAAVDRLIRDLEKVG